MNKYDDIGKTYDSTRSADPYLLGRLAFHLQIGASENYLDIACGSGNYTSQLAELGGNWSGVDRSPVMLEKARAKSSKVKWFESRVEALPFEGDSFRGVTCTLAIHHFDSLRAAFREMRRVSNGKFVLFTSTFEQMKGYWLRKYFPVAMERSRDQMPAMDEILESLHSAGFETIEVEPYFIHAGLQDFFLYSGKHRPEMYLDPSVRRGISTFSSLASEAEIEEGCADLKADIESGRIDEIISSYENDLGDYCFVVCE